MSPDTLDRILTKLDKEWRWPRKVSGISLYNWGEPLLHPRIGEMIRIVHKHGYVCRISSNLNDIRNLDQALRAEPGVFKISLSGYYQEHYGKTHVGGDIEKVKENMVRLRLYKRDTTHVQVIYHRYKGREHEENSMRLYALGLGFEFIPITAFMMPLEKAMEYVAPGEFGTLPLTDDDRRTIGMLNYDLKDVLVGGYEKEACYEQHKKLTMDWRGEVQVCCNTYTHTLGNFLEVSLKELKERNLKHSFCATCSKYGGHVYINTQFNDERN